MIDRQVRSGARFRGGTAATENPMEATDGSEHRMVAVVIPAYNEERFIGSVVLRTREYADAVIVVDDGSTDATAQIAEAAGAVVVRHDRNQGKGVALNTGFKKARELAPDAVVTLDGDAQHLPAEMSAVLDPVLRGEADIVVGSRYLPEANDTPRSRVWGHRAMNLLTNVASGVHLTDSQSGYRAFSPKGANAIAFQSNGFSVESEMQFLAQENGLKMMEVPITIRYDDEPKRNVMVHGAQVLNGVMRLISERHPLLVFSVPGLFMLLAGLVWGVVVVNIYRASQTLAVGYALIVVLLALLGMLSLSTGITLRSIRVILEDILRVGAEPRGVRLAGSITRLVGKRRILLVLGMTGLTAILAGLAWGVVVVEIYRASQELAVGYALMVILLLLGGIVTIFTTIMLQSMRTLILDLMQPSDR